MTREDWERDGLGDYLPMEPIPGYCPNCFHTFECDLADAEIGRMTCDPDKNSMEHVCPPNRAHAEERYDLVVMGPIRRYLRARNGSSTQ